MSPSKTAPREIYKTEYGIPIRNLWHMLLYAWDELPVNGDGGHGATPIWLRGLSKHS